MPVAVCSAVQSGGFFAYYLWLFNNSKSAMNRQRAAKIPVCHISATNGDIHYIRTYADDYLLLIAACAAARRAIGTRNGEQET